MRNLKRIGCALLAGTLIATSALPVTVNAASWKKDAVGWWYQEDNGSWPANQWKKIGGQWYWFQSNGYIATGWRSIDGQWYYFQSDGYMVTGWRYIGGQWYYFQPSGAMLGEGWHVIAGSWYYMYSSGAMASNTWIGDSYVNASGAWVPGKTKSQARWIKSGNRWWYQHADGSYTRNGWEQINDSWYYFDSAGWMMTGWIYSNANWYYLQSDGVMLGEGWHQIDGDWYYMYSDGVMATNTWIGEDYVNASGVRIDASTGIYLLDVLKPYSTPAYKYTEYVDKSFAMAGNQYTNGFTCKSDGVQTVYFNLAGQYKKLSFISGSLDEDQVYGDMTTVRIVADGKQVASYPIKKGDLPVAHEVEINNCKQLQIVVDSGHYYGGKVGIAELKVKNK